MVTPHGHPQSFVDERIFHFFLLCPYVNLLLKAPECFPNFFSRWVSLFDRLTVVQWHARWKGWPLCVCVCAPHPLLQCCRGDAEQACASLLKRGRCAKVSAQDRADECCTHRGQTTNLTADSLKRGKKCLEWKGYYVVKRKKKRKEKDLRNGSVCAVMFTASFIFSAFMCFYVLMNLCNQFCFFFQFYWADFYLPK